MYKCWYYIIEGGSKGPFTVEEMKLQPHFTLDSLVWKEGFSDWTPAKEVEEIKEAFEEPPKKPKPQADEALDQEESLDTDGDVAVAEDKQPPLLPFWFFVLIFLLMYLLARFLLNG